MLTGFLKKCKVGFGLQILSEPWKVLIKETSQTTHQIIAYNFILQPKY